MDDDGPGEPGRPAEPRDEAALDEAATFEALRAQAADPRTSAERLFELSTLDPELLPALASNPNLYAGLRDWLAALDDPEIDAALGLGDARAAAGGRSREVDAEPSPRPGAIVRTPMSTRRSSISTSYTAPAKGHGRGYGYVPDIGPQRADAPDRLPPVHIPGRPASASAATRPAMSPVVEPGVNPSRGPVAEVGEEPTAPEPSPGAPRDGTALPGRSRGATALTVVALLLAVGIGGYLLGSRALSDAGSAATPTAGTGGRHGPPAPALTTDTPTTSAEALEALRQRRSDSLEVLSFDGHWMIQLASKRDRQVDDYQTTAAGSHTFDLLDIWQEHEAITLELADDDIPVYLLEATDFGPQRQRNDIYWVTLADPGTLETEEDAVAACAQLFPGLSGDELENSCRPRTLDPPSIR